MAENKKNREEKVTLEALLRLKRAERPDEAFWGKFDRELHQRMLQTLVRKDPWPVQLVQLFRVRAVQGIGVACAAIAFLFVMSPTAEVLKPVNQSTGISGATEAEATLYVMNEVESEAQNVRSNDLPATIDRTDFGIGNIAQARPAEEASFTREFGASTVRVVTAMATDYRPDYVATSSGYSAAFPMIY